MGDWSDYFEDFPEENSASWVDGRFDPVLAAQLREQERRANEAQARANAELDKMIADAKKATKARSLLVIEECPQCGMEALRTYRISETFYLSECHDCGICGNGTTHEGALDRIRDAFGEGHD